MKREDCNAYMGLLDQDLGKIVLIKKGPNVKMEFIADFEMTASFCSDSFKSSSSVIMK